MLQHQDIIRLQLLCLMLVVIAALLMMGSDPLKGLPNAPNAKRNRRRGVKRSEQAT